MTGVLIEQRPAIEVLEQHDSPETLHYVDPPYLHGLRVMRGHGCYRHEMTDEEHGQLLDVLARLRGMVVLSGYSSEIYDQALSGWQRITTRARISAGRGTGLRDEVLWISPPAWSRLRRHGELFEVPA